MSFRRGSADDDHVRSDEDEADAVEHALDRAENYPFEIDLLLADSGFNNERIIRRAREISATVVHVPRDGERSQDKFDTHEPYHRGVSKDKLTPYLRALQLWKHVCHKSGDEALKNYLRNCAMTPPTILYP